ncbi:MAG: dTDP-4-dehydrorhamnose 3,5-epimerase family protein [Chloroflexota bacterium]|nr:dTDP-4-dehydrorhamnose 3,5-epimerase family protein [Chloroflexota bacterium]
MSENGVAIVRDLLVRDASGSGRIDGAIVRELRVNRDPRGTLTELLRSDWSDLYGAHLPFAQVYTSTTAPGVARDESQWHVHRHQTDRFYCLAGRIVVAIADVRPTSATRGGLILVDLAADTDAPAPLVVTIPPGTLHGFVVTGPGPAILLNFPNRLFDPTDEGRVPFAEAGVTLPDGTPFSYDLARALA